MNLTKLGTKIKRLLENGNTRSADSHIFICCPFHGEREPSCSVVIYSNEFAPGTFHCFGCGESGGWNKLADQLKIDFKINHTEVQAILQNSIKPDDEDLTTELPRTVPEFIQRNHIESYISWPLNKDWRGVNYQFMKMIDAYLIHERNEQQVLFPIKIRDEIVGIIKGSLTERRYINSSGSWVKTRGLFPFNVAQSLMNNWRLKFIVLVEGPRDVARLTLAGIPALAILGSKQWSDEKVNLLLSIHVEDFEVFTIFDRDRAGDEAKAKVKKSLDGLATVTAIKLPKEVEENGEMKRCDVFNLDKKRFSKLVKFFEKRFERLA